MPAFKTNVYTEVTDHVRRNAEMLGCKLSMGSKKVKKLLDMNERGYVGEDGKPHIACLCKVNTYCPCQEAPEEVKTTDHCYCEIFEA